MLTTPIPYGVWGFLCPWYAGWLRMIGNIRVERAYVWQTHLSCLGLKGSLPFVNEVITKQTL